MLPFGISFESFLAIPVALMAGVGAGLNPCCLPLYPAAIGCCSAIRCGSFRSNLKISLAFVFGLSFITTALGLLAASLGHLFSAVTWLSYPIAILLIVFGLGALGVIPVWPPSRTSKIKIVAKGPMTAFLLGIVMGAILTPCATPLLAALLTFVAANKNSTLGGFTLFAYGFGMGIPLLFLSASTSTWIAKFSDSRVQRWANTFTGMLLISVGFYLLWNA